MGYAGRAFAAILVVAAVLASGCQSTDHHANPGQQTSPADQSRQAGQAGETDPVGQSDPTARTGPTDHVDIIVSAHRGGAGQWPQNSLLAFENALAAGYDEIEADTWLVRGGTPVVYHDSTINKVRCPGRFAGRKIRSLTPSQVKQIRCDGQPIPTVQQLLDLFSEHADSHTVLRLEVKTYQDQSDAEARSWAKQVGQLIVDAGLTDRVVMQDFDWAGIAGFHDADPKMRVSALISEPTAALAQRAADLGAYDLSYSAQFATAEFNQLLVSLDLVPTVWGLEDVPKDKPSTPSQAEAATIQEAFRKQVALGARVIITNYPQLDVAARSEMPR